MDKLRMGGKKELKTKILLRVILVTAALFLAGCADALSEPTEGMGVSESPDVPTVVFDVPQADRWGIYSLDLSTQKLDLIFSSPDEMTSLRPSPAEGIFVFSMKVGGDSLEHTEIFTLDLNGDDLRQLTDNDHWDVYPAWSFDGSQIAFLSWRDSNLDIYIMQADGSDQKQLYDSGGHDADIHWLGNQIAFTRDSQIWIMGEDGAGAHQLTDPPRAGEWGNANLPFGDYDPRISPDGSQIVFSRMVDDRSPHGNYDLYTVGVDGLNEVRLTDSGYTQGLSSWSHSGDRILFMVSAIDDAGQYDIYMMNRDGTEIRNITPGYFPNNFLCHWAIFGEGDTEIYFLGEWWSEE